MGKVKLTDDQKKAILNTGADIASKINWSFLKKKKKGSVAPPPTKVEPKKEEPKKVEPKKPNYLLIAGLGVLGIVVLGGVVYVATKPKVVSVKK